MQPRERSIERQKLGPDWLNTADAARAVGASKGQLTDEIRHLITHKTRSVTGASTARAVGYAYAKHDLERMQVIMQATGCKPLRAAQLLSLMRSCELRGLVLAELSETLMQREARLAAEAVYAVPNDLPKPLRRKFQ